MKEKELRMALVCCGGVSLAIYMHGLSSEILKLVRASGALHCKPACQFDQNFSLSANPFNTLQRRPASNSGACSHMPSLGRVRQRQSNDFEALECHLLDGIQNN